VSLPKLVAPPDPGKGSLAVEMRTQETKKSLGNASSAGDDGSQHLIQVIFAKGNQDVDALKSCASKHCQIGALTITEMAHSSGGSSTALTVYTLYRAIPMDFAEIHCASPNGKDLCRMVHFYYGSITEHKPAHSH
jgi:hypothetical protein